MTLHVFVEGMAAYEVEDRWVARAPVTPGWGMVIPVGMIPDQPQRVAVDWKALAEQQAAEGEERRERLAAMGPVGPEGIEAPAAGRVVEPDDPALREQRLDALAAAGIEVPDRGRSRCVRRPGDAARAAGCPPRVGCLDRTGVPVTEASVAG
jgi:hypothetical protein